MPELQTLQGGLEARDDAKKQSWIVAAAPLAGNNVLVGLAMRQWQLFTPTYLRVGTDFFLPILMLGLAWVAIWLSTERQITQWINYLRRIAAAYRGGHYGAKPRARRRAGGIPPARQRHGGDGRRHPGPRHAPQGRHLAEERC